MPELPEVQALVDFLAERTAGLAVTGVELGSISVLKTFTPPPQALVGAPVDGVSRHGKFLDLDCGGTHLVFHLARAGWLRWSEAIPATVLRPGKSPIALRVRLDDGSGFDLTAIVSGHRMQVKGLLRDQSILAGVGNAYSDEILHVAKLSPFAISASLKEEDIERLYAALRGTLSAAVRAASGKPAKELKDAKRAGMRVHGRTGEVCPECGDTVREVSFADSSLQYCATCQTGGKPLADRRTSKFLK